MAGRNKQQAYWHEMVDPGQCNIPVPGSHLVFPGSFYENNPLQKDKTEEKMPKLAWPSPL
jgi:hypothetical protein